MKMKYRPLVMGNWKMHPKTEKLALRLYKDIAHGVSRVKGVDIAIAPAFIHLSGLCSSRSSSNVVVGAQDCHFEPLGAFTGEVSVPMLKDVGASYIIVGHSERRKAGERDEEVTKKVHAVLKAGLMAVVCVGEEKRDPHAEYFSFIEAQLRSACAGVSRTALRQLIVAYEPIWAIGTGKYATPEDAHEMKLFIQKILTEIYSRNDALKVRILYGGSVNAKNADDLMGKGTVDGFLVGGASLKADEFISICRSAAHYGR